MRKVKGNNKKIAIVCLPFLMSIFEKFKGSVHNNIRTVFKSISNFWRYLSQIKPPLKKTGLRTVRIAFYAVVASNTMERPAVY